MDETSTGVSSLADINITVPRLTGMGWSIVLFANFPLPSINITILAQSTAGKVKDLTSSGTYKIKRGNKIQ